ncbi:MAG: M3 family metallopeptidase [Myxococcota bacterium]|nr:M3 family metallopeptidase [Myxococcota bacterium]
MSRRFLPIALFLLAACLPVPAPPPAPQTARPGPVEPPAPPADPAVALRAKAQADIARLTAEADQQVMLAAWAGPHGGVPPWDQVKVELVGPAFTTGLALLLAEIDMIATNPERPTFANTIVPLEDAGRHQDRAETLFSVLTSSLNTPDVQAVDREWSPKLAAAYDAIKFNDKLFARIAAVHAARTQGLTPEQQRLVELTHDRFVNAGAKLDAKQKQELGRINQELATLFTDFGNKVLADENTWIVIDKAADLAGIPASMRGGYKAAADERKLNDPGAAATPGAKSTVKWAIVNTRSSVDPFLTYSTRRDLRERVWKAFKSRGDNANENDTNKLIARIVALRGERAALLGYATHAHWRMFNTMAIDPAKAEALMLRVWPAAVARVKEEVADMQKIAKREGMKGPIEPWDYLYYAEKVRKQKYALDQDQLKPYFELDNMVKGAFFMAEQLYDLTFQEITGTLPVFQADVRVFEVKDKATGAHRGVFYLDNFARANKRSGAWASGYRGHETFSGTKRTAITSNNNNFVKGAPGEPVLISLDDAQTLFHEFGHAIHGLLSEVNYPGLASTPRDFVEYPSQVHEMWVMTRPVLDRFGLHYKTKQPMPQALAKKVEASKRFNQGYATVEYLSSAIVDMALHTTKADSIDPDAFERDTLTRIGAPKEVVMRHRLPQFNHLFTSDSYSAGYYSYLWSEVMDADTRQAFLEAGDVFHKPTADKMRKFILAPGNTTDRAEAYRQFRGRDPDVKALLEKRGFPTK